MSPGHLSYLRRVRGPKEFLKHVGWMAGNTMLNFRVDLALTHYLLGNVDQCIEILGRLPLEDLPPPFRVHIVPFFTELRTSPADAASRLQAWERENVERLGLAETDEWRGGRENSDRGYRIPQIRSGRHGAADQP